ncbi:SIR2 family protein [Nocardioides sp. URHA0020]|uniref:SIR2 family protein n=1 Tax=Nocardioides sp. URHA0020 TaxID=1380392 RepID=UPI000688174D|nr:SIR2 family protein [Nocardioides sp. URHA0020]
MSTSHVFVVHGRMESVVHDAAVVPTDDSFAVEAHWSAVTGCSDHGRLRPSGWPGAGYGRARDGRAVWFISVGPGLSTEQLMTRARAVVEDVVAQGLRAGNDRTSPVLALPVLGLEGGGHGRDRGGVVHELLRTLHEITRSADLDIAVVTPERSVHAAAQHVRGQLHVDVPYLEEARRLGELARRGELALFLGAGVSRSAGMPTWRELLRQLGRRTGQLGEHETHTLTPLDQAQLLEHRVPELGKHVAEICSQHDRPSLAHALLAGLGCREVVTTNFDGLYETAALADGQPAVAVLPWESPVGAPAWVLKMHGDVRHPRSIVLTRRDVVRFDAHARPAGALLQTLLLTRHVLVVGASMTDDNVVRLVQEAQVYRELHGVDGSLGTLLDVDGDAARGELWEDTLHWLTLPGEGVAERIRALEIFLDAIGRYAADDASWLLDPRFDGLLDEESRRTAREVYRLRARLPSGDASWQALARRLDELGAGAPPPECEEPQG